MFWHSQNTAGDHFPHFVWLSFFHPTKTIKEEVQAVSGRACCGGNGDLCSSEQTASDVIALCQTVHTAQSETRKHTPAHRTGVWVRKGLKENFTKRFI